jgi:hypothetical protein
VRRYSSATAYAFGKATGASPAPTRIYDAIVGGQVSYDVRVLQEGERIDTIAGQVYGDSSLWWVIAAASGIGWALQVPPGTRLLIPNMQQVSRFI